MATLSAQSILASASDSAGARAVKFLAGNMIPVVGSTVGDTLRTLAASVKLMRSTVGVAGIVALALLLLPTIIELFLTRFVFNTAAAVGELLGCKSAVRLYREIASLYGYIIAAAALSSLLCVFALTLFAIGGVAIGGG
jgi:stage III sporulation protein AE